MSNLDSNSSFSTSASSSTKNPKLDGYTILSPLDVGGVKRVFKAEQHLFARVVAIKVFTKEAASASEQALARFINEARTMARVKQHPNIAQVYDFARSSAGEHCIVMEFVDGRRLSDMIILAGGAMPARECARIARDAARALAHAHANNVVHRDIKPENIMVANEGGAVKVMDFGFARVEGETRLTMAGEMVGTPFYMSPEQILGEKEIDHRADIYSLGVLLYQMACGRRPFEEKNIFGMMEKHRSEQPPPPSEFEPKVTPDLEKVIMRAIAKKKEDRYQSAAEMEEALDVFLGVRSAKSSLMDKFIGIFGKKK
jgi:serine/threonine protein kinase